MVSASDSNSTDIVDVPNNDSLELTEKDIPKEDICQSSLSDDSNVTKTTPKIT